LCDYTNPTPFYVLHVCILAITLKLGQDENRHTCDYVRKFGCIRRGSQKAAIMGNRLSTHKFSTANLSKQNTNNNSCKILCHISMTWQRFSDSRWEIEMTSNCLFQVRHAFESLRKVLRQGRIYVYVKITKLEPKNCNMYVWNNISITLVL